VAIEGITNALRRRKGKVFVGECLSHDAQYPPESQLSGQSPIVAMLSKAMTYNYDCQVPNPNDNTSSYSHPLGFIDASSNSLFLIIGPPARNYPRFPPPQPNGYCGNAHNFVFSTGGTYGTDTA